MNDRPDRRTIRLSHYDYRRGGAYFVTICSHERSCIFGVVRDGQIELSEIGKILAPAWHDLPNHHPQVVLDEFTIMPNHIHGILFLTDSADTTDIAGYVPTSRFGAIRSGSLSAVVRSFKAAVTKKVRETLRREEPVWQSRFHEHVIRNDEDLYQVRKYIQENPLQWELDKENPKNL